MTGDDEADAARLAVEVRRGSPTDEELAAAVAVITAAYAQETADATADEPHGDAWRLAARGLRRPMRRDLGWRGFTG